MGVKIVSKHKCIEQNIVTHSFVNCFIYDFVVQHRLTLCLRLDVYQILKWSGKYWGFNRHFHSFVSLKFSHRELATPFCESFSANAVKYAVWILSLDELFLRQTFSAIMIYTAGKQKTSSTPLSVVMNEPKNDTNFWCTLKIELFISTPCLLWI